MKYYAILETHDTLTHIGDKWYASQFGKAIPVTVIEDEDPTHWGWLGTGEDVYSLVWPNKDQFEMCFPWGSKHEERAGKGRVCKLRVEVENV